MLTSHLVLLCILSMFVVGLFSFCSKMSNLLIMLMSLEYLVLSLFLLIMVYLNTTSYSSFFLIVFLVFSVCEGAIGLSIVVSMVRAYGNDLLSSLNSLNLW
uniref:NADH-ubiquinone oxidoreductase chain 4L n=1 Tax=Mirhipipteryx andensis TaxID=1564103 RepID=A0A0N7AXV0_9ORTH|nr:NADH dehydrogenase subunit 4L [Mirhipipteryx andensis]AJW76429.1 NADH dehydrogenase subunit 4L [Mirhipipteryx andensis]